MPYSNSEARKRLEEKYQCAERVGGFVGVDGRVFLTRAEERRYIFLTKKEKE
jgi:hypothetical protein